MVLSIHVIDGISKGGYIIQYIERSQEIYCKITCRQSGFGDCDRWKLSLS